MAENRPTNALPAEAAEEIELLRDSLAQLLSETERLEDERAALAQRVAQLSGQMSDRHMVTTLNSALEAQLADHGRSRVGRETMLGALLLKDGVLQADHVRLQKENANLRSELDRVYRSRSWKITAPIRGVRHGLGKKS